MKSAKVRMDLHLRTAHHEVCDHGFASNRANNGIQRQGKGEHRGSDPLPVCVHDYLLLCNCRGMGHLFRAHSGTGGRGERSRST